MPTRIAWLLALAGCWLTCVSARADERPQLGVEVLGCDAASEIRAIVALELGANIVTGSFSGTAPALRGGAVSAPGEHATQARARCTAGRAELAVIDPLTSKTLSRAIVVERVDPRARARVIGIAIAELVSASWFELARAPARRAHAAQRSSARQRTAALRTVRRRAAIWRTSLGAGPLLRISPGQHEPAPGASLQLSAQSPWSPRLLFDVGGFHVARELTLGSVSTTAVALGAAGLLHVQGAAFGFDAGAGARAGIGLIRGHTDDRTLARQADVSGPWLGPMLVTGGSLALGDWGSLQLVGELGYALIAVRGRSDGADAAAIDQLWIALALSLHVEL